MEPDFFGHIINAHPVIVHMACSMMNHDHGIRHDSMHEAECHSGVSLMSDGPLPLDVDIIGAAADGFLDFKFDGSRDVVADNGIDRDAASGEENSCLACCNKIGFQSPPDKFTVELKRGGHFADVAVGSDGENRLRFAPLPVSF